MPQKTMDTEPDKIKLSYQLKSTSYSLWEPSSVQTKQQTENQAESLRAAKRPYKSTHKKWETIVEFLSTDGFQNQAIESI